MRSTQLKLRVKQKKVSHHIDRFCVCVRERERQRDSGTETGDAADVILTCF